MLKVGSPQPQDAIPSMTMNNGLDDGNTEMGDETMEDPQMPPMEQSSEDMPMGDEENPFDTNFDAGVDADEESDPKRYIQQLTGKLSQTLNQYNDGLPQSDSDLNKYVAGMILKQTTKGLSPEDVNDILNNMKEDEDVATNESKISRKMQIDEIFQDIIQDSNKEEVEDRPLRNVGFRKKPYSSPNFKS